MDTVCVCVWCPDPGDMSRCAAKAKSRMTTITRPARSRRPASRSIPSSLSRPRRPLAQSTSLRLGVLKDGQDLASWLELSSTQRPAGPSVRRRPQGLGRDRSDRRQSLKAPAAVTELRKTGSGGREVQRRSRVYPEAASWKNAGPPRTSSRLYYSVLQAWSQRRRRSRASALARSTTMGSSPAAIFSARSLAEGLGRLSGSQGNTALHGMQ